MSQRHEPLPSAIAFIESEHTLLIDNTWVESTSGRKIVVTDPATGDMIGQFCEGCAADVDRAVNAARSAFDHGRWRQMSAAERGKLIWTLADLIERNAEELVHIEIMDNGMPMAFAEAMISWCSNWLRHFAGMADKVFGRNASSMVSAEGVDIHAYTASEPVGVAGLIVPWNAPSGTMIIKLAPALAAGCTVVIKPDENTSMASLRIMQLAIEAGFPAGVINMVTGNGPEVGAAMAAHPGIDKISFTGSTEVGKSIIQAASGNLKRVTLELGGKSPVIVFDDADIEQAIPAISMAIFGNTGQVCFAGSRLFVQRGIYDRVLDGVRAFAESLQIGSGFDERNLIGPLISEKQMRRVAGYIDMGVAQGAEVISGGNRMGDRGYFMQPTIFANAGSDSRIVREEIFGPVLVATPFDDVDVAINMANDTRYGLGAGVFSKNVANVHRTAARLQAGNVWVNCYGMTHATMPFGGYKESGWGREMGQEGLDAYLEKKSVFVQLD